MVSESPASTFAGFPVAALDFYDDLEVDNTRAYWEKHKDVYTESVKAPMAALCAALAPEFGEAKVFRPYRDVRFAKDKTPYKTHQGAVVHADGHFYEASSPRLAAIRAAIADDLRGAELERLLADLAAQGWDVAGDKLKTTPRGYSADHPRIELLRHRSMTVGRSHGFEPVVHTPELLDVVRDDWRALRPFVEWVARNAE